MNKHPMTALGEMHAVQALLEHMKKGLEIAKTQQERDLWVEMIKKLESEVAVA